MLLVEPLSLFVLLPPPHSDAEEHAESEVEDDEVCVGRSTIVEENSRCGGWGSKGTICLASMFE